MGIEIELMSEGGLPYTIIPKPMGMCFSILLGDRKLNISHRDGKLVISEVEANLQVSINKNGDVIL